MGKRSNVSFINCLKFPAHGLAEVTHEVVDASTFDLTPVTIRNDRTHYDVTLGVSLKPFSVDYYFQAMSDISTSRKFISSVLPTQTEQRAYVVGSFSNDLSLSIVVSNFEKKIRSI